MSNVNISVFFKRHDLKFNVMVGWLVGWMMDGNMDHLRTPELLKRKVKVTKEYFTNTLNAEFFFFFFMTHF